MKKAIVLSLVILGAFVNISVAQDTKTIKLEQTPGQFTVQSLTLLEGTYIFEIANNGVDHEVGFVLAPKGKTEAESHIKEAYVLKTVADGTSQTSQEVKLSKGKYVYFCPLNPTEQYALTVN